MNVLYINNGKQDVLSKGDYLLSAAKKMGLTNVQAFGESIKLSSPPEYVLNVQPYAKNFKVGTKWVGSWEVDCLINREQMMWYWGKLDTVFMANRVDWLEMVPKKVRYLMQACDPDLYNFKVEQKYDMVQIGSVKDIAYWRDYGIRDDNYKYKESSDFDIYKTRTEVWDKLKERYNVFVYKAAERLPVKEYLQILAQGKIQFIRSMDVMGEGEIAQRFFESLPMGPVLTNYAQDLDYLNLTPDADYCFYRDEEEMFEKIDWLLGDRFIRDDIAMHGREKAYKEHTYEIRLREILDYLTAHYGFKQN